MKKRVNRGIWVALLVMLLTGCSKTPQTLPPESSAAETTGGNELPSVEPETNQTQISEQDKQIRVTALNGPTAMGMIPMMAQDQEGKQEYDFNIVTAIDEVTASLVKGEIDLAAIPANLAAVLYQNTQGQIQVLGINTLGVLYLVENGESVQSVADLQGKTIYAVGKGATPELALNYILEANGLTSGTDVTVEFKSEPTECVAMLAQEPEAVAMLPQPFVTIAIRKNETFRIALDLTKEWDAVNPDSALLTGVVVARKEFAQQYPEAVGQFLTAYQNSVNDVNEKPQEVAELIETYGIVSADIASEAIPYCNITLIEGDQMKTLLQGYFLVLEQQNAQAIGGRLPDEEFYFIR